MSKQQKGFRVGRFIAKQLANALTASIEVGFQLGIYGAILFFAEGRSGFKTLAAREHRPISHCWACYFPVTVRREFGSEMSLEELLPSGLPECLDQMIFVGKASLNHAVSEFVEHYRDERPHQGLANELIRGRSAGEGVVDMNERLGGLLKYFHRRAA